LTYEVSDKEDLFSRNQIHFFLEKVSQIFKTKKIFFKIVAKKKIEKIIKKQKNS